MKPGCYTIPAHEYHAMPQLSNSLAQLLITQSPLHAWTACKALNPNYVEEEKEAFDIGSAAHALLLEGQDRMVVIEAPDWRTKEARAARDSARALGKHPILAHKYQDVMKMRDVAVRAISECTDLGGLALAEGQAEQVLVWEEQGVDCRARPDSMFMQRGIVLDYKSTTNATPAFFSRQIARMGYHYQDEFYSRGYLSVFGKRPRFVFLAQETTAPYACSFHDCDPSLQAIAEQDITWAIKRWGECLKGNRWPDHDRRIHSASATPWQLEEAAERADALGIPYDVSKLWNKEAA